MSNCDCDDCKARRARWIERESLGHPAAPASEEKSLAQEVAWKGVDYAIRRLQADINDGSRPDQWSMEDIVRGLRPALDFLAVEDSTGGHG
jgi:hypothetical protein